MLCTLLKFIYIYIYIYIYISALKVMKKPKIIGNIKEIKKTKIIFFTYFLRLSSTLATLSIEH